MWREGLRALRGGGEYPQFNHSDWTEKPQLYAFLDKALFHGLRNGRLVLI